VKRILVIICIVALTTVLGLSNELVKSSNTMMVSQLAVLEIQENRQRVISGMFSRNPSGVLRNFLEEHNAPSFYARGSFCKRLDNDRGKGRKGR
jgi:hypothetical protein